MKKIMMGVALLALAIVSFPLPETKYDEPFRVVRRIFINLDYFDLVEIPLMRLLGCRLYLYNLIVVC